MLLRPLSSVHSSAAATLPNRELITDPTIQVFASLLAGSIYYVGLSTAYGTVFPTTLVLYFNGIPKVVPAGSASAFPLVSLPAAVFCVLFGLAARAFIFAPFATTGRSPDDTRIGAFDPAHATLAETVWWNAWGYTARSKVAIVRTAAVVLVTAVRTYLQCSITISGVEPFGALVYALVWATTALLAGLGLIFIGRD